MRAPTSASLMVPSITAVNITTAAMRALQSSAMRAIRMVVLVLLAAGLAPAAAEFRFRPQELVTQFGVGYAVSVADINGDRKPDVVAISGTQVVWFENPTWQKHV